MSRIGRKPIPVPPGVDISIEGTAVTVKGPKGTLSRDFHRDMKVSVRDGVALVERPSDNKLHRSLHGLSRTLLNNMVQGVTVGFAKQLELVGVGYRASKQGSKLVLALGYSHPVEIEPGAGLEVDVPAPNRVVVKGIDKEKVGSLAALIWRTRPPEPYKGKGVRYEGEVVRRKVGKTGGKGKK
ncbi:MAG: 50S ribosomal protein L6 [Peptococcaceae bacterium]|jgi:large subunit ribosomal protein L6|nr:50S ribosomal protein L6 [Peptococcaceae bacterium]